MAAAPAPPESAQGEVEHEVLSLGVLCMQSIVGRKFVTNEALLQLCSFCAHTDMLLMPAAADATDSAPTPPAPPPPPRRDDDASSLLGAQLRRKLLALVRGRFPMLLERVEGGAAALRELLGGALFDALRAEHEEGERAKRFLSGMRGGGSVVEARPCVAASPTVTQGGAGGQRECYPYAALVAGVAWPPGVRAAAREEHLADGEFESVFGFGRAEFAALCKYKRVQHKKRVNLF